ncbi:MAG: hypothetical protein OXU75_20935 [Deltaproteobacteria bacterium]|nr:hypothetical protein [Deltaproteobacteria bacterium]
MSSAVDNSKGQKVMLGFVVRRCARELGHTPTPHEFAVWANNQSLDGERYNIFGQAISAEVATVMLRRLDRLVTIRSRDVILGQPDLH